MARSPFSTFFICTGAIGKDSKDRDCFSALTYFAPVSRCYANASLAKKYFGPGSEADLTSAIPRWKNF